MAVLLAAVEAGSLSRVARERGVAVSSIARRIDALEEDLGVKLLKRGARQLLLTDAGEAFLPRARAIVSELSDARHAIAELSSDPRGLLTVAAPASFGRRHMVSAVASFLALHPAIEIDLHLSDDLLDLSTQRVDLAVRMGVLPNSDLVATMLSPVQRFVCASPAYLARHGKPRTPQDLLRHNCLCLATPPFPSGWWTFAGVNDQLPLPVTGNLRSDDTEALLGAAVAGVGVAHLASWLVSDDLVAGRLVPVFAPALAAKGPRLPAIHAVRLPGRSHAAKAQLFIAHLRRAFGAPAYWDTAVAGLI
ncbi:MAG TPA: LysR family transcriptional regulator [Burkholderiaceae bacterium]|nr:LysR family transcriptional regulator [Burkholderiaceae bacterium]